MTMNPTQHTLNSLAAAIRDGSISAKSATAGYLARIEQLDPQLTCFHEVYAERALARAEAVDRGEVSGPLAGVPIALKDNMCTDYGHTTCSSKMLENFAAPYQSTLAARLEAAGAVILGKTNLDEFAMGSSTENSAFGPSRNPWDTTRVPGGSSGGSASACAADLAAATLGSDTGGSIRQPAALCGIVGIKPTYGLISRYGLIAFASSLDQIGPFTRDITDAAILMNVIAGHDPLDSTSAPDEVSGGIPDYTADLDTPLSGLRLGIARQYMSDEANHPAMTAALNDAIAFYKDHGATIVEVDLPHTEYGIPTYYIVATAEASSNLARYDGIHYGHRSEQASDLIDLVARSRAEGFGDEVKRRIMLGTYVLSSGYYDAYYNRALKVRRLIKNDFDQAFAQVDAILCPTTTGPAFAFGEKSADPLAMYLNDIYTVNGNLAGIPGISFPGGFAEENGKKLPLGLQLLGPTFSESRLLRIARQYEKAHNWVNQRPGI